MRVLGRKTKSQMLQAAGTARVVIAIYGDATQCQFEPRRLGSFDELEIAIRSHNFVGLLCFVGIPPLIFLARSLDSKAALSFNELTSRLTSEAAQSPSFWQPAPAPLAMVSGTRTIEAR
jgi:hypothetical protein